ncbi:MAG TPA: hypothetical protein VGE32_15485 [Cellvibrio sp.]
MNLPGGLIIEIDGQPTLVRDFSFRPITGALEMQLQDLLCECSANDEAHPVWISRFLTVILARLAMQKIELDDEKNMAKGLELVRELCVGDRHFLLLQWRLMLAGGSDYEWLSAHCPACVARYDFPLEWAQLPVKPAGENFPKISFLLNDSSINNGEAIQVRVPRGSDQEFIAQLNTQSKTDLRRQLLQRLVIADNPQALVQALDDDDIARIETALEQAAPELAQQLQLACPECGEQHRVQLDWYRGIYKPVDELLDQVHRLAANYHWSEQEILALPKQRRAAYLLRLDRDRGVSSWAEATGAAL